MRAAEQPMLVRRRVDFGFWWPRGHPDFGLAVMLLMLVVMVVGMPIMRMMLVLMVMCVFIMRVMVF